MSPMAKRMGWSLSEVGAVRKIRTAPGWGRAEDPHGPGGGEPEDYLEVTLKPWSLPYFTSAFCHASRPLSSEVPFS